MRTALSILFVMMLTAVLGQDAQANGEEKKLWLTVKAYPSFTRDIFGTYSHEVIFEHSQRKVISYGIEMTKELKENRWYFEAGVLINNWGYKEKAWSDFIKNYEPSYTSVKSRYITVPTLLIFRHKKLYFGLGISNSLFINSKVTTDKKTTIYEKPDYFDNRAPTYWLLGFQAKTGLVVELTDKFTFRPELYGIITEPYYNYPQTFWQLSLHGFYSWGLGVGIDYKIQ